MTYLLKRFPPHTLGVAVAASYGCACLLYAISCPARPSPWRLGAGAVSFVLLFLLLRLADDLEDAAHDAARDGGPSARARRVHLGAGFACATAALVVLNWGQAASWLALAAAGGMLVTSLGLKPWLTPRDASGPSTTDSAARDALLGVFFEGVPVLIFVYVHASWQSATGCTLPVTVVALVSATQWATYEFWTYSRYATRPGWRPYGLSWAWVRRGLVGVLGLWLGVQVLLARVLELSALFVAQAACVAIFFAAWLHRVAPEARGPSRAVRLRGALGLSFTAAANAGIVLAYVSRP